MGNSGSSLPKKQRSIVIEDDPREGFGPVHRSPLSPNNLVDKLDDGVESPWGALENVVSKFGKRTSFGKRKQHKDGTAGDFEFITYAQAFERAENIAGGLCALGAEQGSKIGLFSINRTEWVLGDIACFRQGFISVPLYDTLGPQAVEYVIGQAGITHVICSGDHVEAILGCAEKCEELKYIISMDEVEAEVPEALADRVKVMTIEQLEKEGAENKVEPSPSGSTDLATINYTSGTTGNPKGVMLTNEAFVAIRAAIQVQGIEITENDWHISYLPLAHIFERMLMFILVSRGSTIGFFQGDVLKLFDDISTLRPTLFVSVPRLLNRLFDKVNMAMEQKGGVAKMLFTSGLAKKKQQLATSGKLTHGFYDGLVFNKIKAKLGGRCKLVITGSAPLSAEVMDFLQCCLCCPVLQGYGLTETSAASCVTAIDNVVGGHVGGPVACVEVRLADVPDMDYTSEDKPFPRGEVCFRGASVTKGYYLNDEKTAEAFTDDWFHTGDIGRWNADNTLSIIDRKKNMFKLAQGEYIAAEKVENVYVQNPNVLQVFIYGDSYQSAVVAIIVPDPEVVKPWCQKNGVDVSDWAAACQNEKVKKMIMQSCASTAKANGLKRFEQFKDLLLSPEDFQVLGLLTPKFSLKRPTAKDHFKEDIDAMYEKINAGERERQEKREKEAAKNQA